MKGLNIQNQICKKGLRRSSIDLYEVVIASDFEGAKQANF